jgi:hypothetical protein
MEAPLFRVISRVAEQRIAEKLRSGSAVHPAELATELIVEFSRFIQLGAHEEALRSRLTAHVEAAVLRRSQG